MPRLTKTSEELLAEALAHPTCSPCESRVKPIINIGPPKATTLVLPLELDCDRCMRELAKKYPTDRAGHRIQFVPMCNDHWALWGVADAVGPQQCDHGVRIVAHPPIHV